MPVVVSRPHLDAPFSDVSAPDLKTAPSPLFDYKQELAKVLFRGIKNHSIIHDLQYEIGVLYGGIIVEAEALPKEFSAAVKDPGMPSPNGRKWTDLTTMEKKDLLFSSIMDFRELNDPNFDETLKFYEKFSARLESISHAVKDFDEEWKKSDIAVEILNSLEKCRLITQAQLDMAKPPEHFPEMSLRNIVLDAVELKTTGPNAYPYGFGRATEDLSSDAALINSQKDLLMRFITECIKNSYNAAVRHEKNQIPAINSRREYYCTVDFVELPDKTYDLIIKDNCGGIPQKFLETDHEGLPDRPLMFNLSTSSGDGGVGTCEMYYIAKALKASLQVENYDPEHSSRKGAITRLSGLRLLEK